MCGALLARRGWRVCLLEREGVPGGAIRTEGITRPGFLHDVYAAWHGEFVGSPAYAELATDLREMGVEYVSADLPTATLYPDGSSVVLSTSPDANAQELDRHLPGDGRLGAMP